MILASYLVGRTLGQPMELVLTDCLPEIHDADDVRFEFAIGERIKGDVYNTSLFIHYIDQDTSDTILDVMCPDLPDDIIKWIRAGKELRVVDSKTNQSLLISQTPLEFGQIA